MNRTGMQARIEVLLWRLGLPLAVVLGATTAAAAAPPPGGARIEPLGSAAMQVAAGDLVLGAGAATALLAGMVLVLAASWRGFRGSLRFDDEDDGAVPPQRQPRRPPPDGTGNAG